MGVAWVTSHSTSRTHTTVPDATYWRVDCSATVLMSVMLWVRMEGKLRGASRDLAGTNRKRRSGVRGHYSAEMERFEFPRCGDPTQPYRPPAAERHEETRDAFGDSGPWTWLLAEAWQQAALPETFAGPLRRPAVPYQDADGHLDIVAYWAPLMSLMHHGLGWRRPDLGLWRWRHEGQSFDDPVLRTLDQRYGTDLDLMLAWLTSGGSHLSQIHGSGELPPLEIPLEMKRHCDMVRSSEAYAGSFGPDSDGHHLGYHVQPMEVAEQVSVVPAAGAMIAGSSIDVIVTADRFHDAFFTLRDGAIAAQTSGRSTRVALFWPSGGWLGNYRCSRMTGLWFRGRHAVHALGKE